MSLHFHDLRRHTATDYLARPLSIPEIMAWEEEGVIRRYVSRPAATHERIRKLNNERKQAGKSFTIGS